MKKWLMLVALSVAGWVYTAGAVPCKAGHALKPGQKCEISFKERPGYFWKHAADKPGFLFIKYRTKRSVAKKGAKGVTRGPLERIFTVKALRPGSVTVKFTEQARNPKDKAAKSAEKVYKITVEKAAPAKGAVVKPTAKKTAAK